MSIISKLAKTYNKGKKAGKSLSALRKPKTKRGKSKNKVVINIKIDEKKKKTIGKRKLKLTPRSKPQGSVLYKMLVK
jgi:hypothetical protein